MGNIKYIVVSLLLGFIELFGATNRYEMKSGIVEYEIVGSVEGGKKGDSITGTSKLYFKDYGNLELTDEKIVQVTMGEKDEERTLSKIVGNKMYSVDFEEEVIYTQKLALDEEDGAMNVKNYDTFVQMGAKNLGKEEILGYKCDVWQLGQDKIWAYNSVPLKQVSKSNGSIQIQQAKLAVFNVDIKDDKFKLPPFPIKAIEEIVGDEGESAAPVVPETHKKEPAKQEPVKQEFKKVK